MKNIQTRSLIPVIVLFCTAFLAACTAPQDVDVSQDTDHTGASKLATSSLFNPNPAPLTIINTISEVDGKVGGFICPDGSVTADPADACGVVSILYPIAGNVYATMTDRISGETLGSVNQLGTVSSEALFDISFFGLKDDWSLLPETMPWTMSKNFKMLVSGSTFTLAEELTGRAFPQLGPVEDPTATGTLALRLAGCAGVRELTGLGDYANKVGTLCLNGTFLFDQAFNGVGVSNCTIAVHDRVIF